MNGRLYDPLLRRFLNADENIQDPYNTQNYNKYGYVLNNPLMYNDPSGEVMGWDDVLIAAGIAIFTSVATDYYMNQPVNIGNMLTNVMMSIMSAGIADGIGSIFTTATGEATRVATQLGKTWTIVARAGAHAISQGALSMMQGGNFWSGALSGAFASISGDLLGNRLDKNPSKFLHSEGFAMMTGAVSGGIGSVLGGGNFWVGAAQGLIVTTFNSLGHKISDNLNNDPPSINEIKILLSSGIITLEEASLATGLSVASLRVALGLISLPLILNGDTDFNYYYVYEIKGFKETAKFGITRQNVPETRPESQLKGIFEKFPKQGKPSWVWKLERVSREVALAAEKYYVSAYHNITGKMPYAQTYPYPNAWLRQVEKYLKTKK